MEEFSNKFNREPDFILNEYDTIYKELQPTFKNYSSTNLYDLSGRMQYIKVINEFQIDSYADDIFEEIIAITYNLLNNE